MGPLTVGPGLAGGDRAGRELGRTPGERRANEPEQAGHHAVRRREPCPRVHFCSPQVAAEPWVRA